jgi:hypothetical protein
MRRFSGRLRPRLLLTRYRKNMLKPSRRRRLSPVACSSWRRKDAFRQPGREPDVREHLRYRKARGCSTRITVRRLNPKLFPLDEGSVAQGGNSQNLRPRFRGQRHVGIGATTMKFRDGFAGAGNQSGRRHESSCVCPARFESNQGFDRTVQRLEIRTRKI